jgi:hypothetical protein
MKLLKKELLTLAEYNDLMYLLEQAKEDGSYFLPKEQYWKRHESIVKKLEKLTNK